MTQLCCSIFVHDLAQAQRDAALAAEAGADLIEYRIDHFDPTIEPGLVENSPLPCIVTCRPTWEGGDSDLSDRERLSRLSGQLSAGASYADVELKTYQRAKPFVPTEGRLIVSAHDFKQRPDRLLNLFHELNEVPAEITKVVWMARTIRDNLEAFELLQNKQKPTIALCMGEAGLISRVLAKKFGAFLTFAGLTTQSVTAPGQVSIHDMKRLYRWDAIQPSTNVYGIVAEPVMHSMSPAIHNAGFEAVNHDGVYLPMLVHAGYESFKAFMESFLNFAPLDLAGLSITLPHKENALRYLKEKGAEIEPLAERIGTVNTIVIQRDDLPPSSPSPRTPGEGRGEGVPPPSNLKLRGFNTDYAAILDTITTTLNITREDLKNYRVAVLGAGGTGRTAVAALAEYGATVVVYNRTFQRAQELANEFNGRHGKVVAARLEKLCDSCCHIFINTTSVGMHPNIDASPLGDTPPKFTPETLVFDTIYNPIKTKLLMHAEAAGAKTVGGIEMFIRQAARQFEAWTNQTAPLDLFRSVVESRLQPI
ncbi:MAG TPA: type I 3-dehydroquinate dehydratase [Tepidisphaeraceae bacterium]|jgi:3-dehydroquinate dehydratase/shikimate dehydrogenase